MSTVRIEIPEPTILLNEWQRLHWRERRKHHKRLAWTLLQAIGHWKRPPIQRCHVTIERYSAKLPDWDGLYGGFKPLLDCLVVESKRNPLGFGVIQDDSPKHILTLTAVPCLAPEGQGRTVVTIEEVG